MEHLAISDCELKELPKEIGNLTKLKSLTFEENILTKLPDEICNLTNLTELYLDDNPDLILTTQQKEWIKKLEASGCEVVLNDDV